MKYKVLMHGHTFVDSNKLNSGIYEAITPHLYPIEKELDDIRNIVVNNYEKFLNTTYGMEAYLRNLNLCKLVEVELKIVE